MSVEELEKNFAQGNLRALTRLISLAENGEGDVARVLANLFPKTGGAKVVGLTGSPGAGKSTLVGAMLRYYRAEKKKVAVLAVDPMSPFTGGSLLGDRIRLSEHFNDEGVFIRSLSTRGKLGGLSPATWQAVHLCDAFGFDLVIIETVGVGQNEVDVRNLVDLAAVVVVPEGGDGVQALKAGVLEIGDWFIVNKADREGADRMESEIQTMLDLAGRPREVVSRTQHKEESTYISLFKKWESYFNDEEEKIAARRLKGRGLVLEALIASRIAEEAQKWVRTQRGEGDNPYQSFVEFLASKKLEKLFPHD